MKTLVLIALALLAGLCVLHLALGGVLRAGLHDSGAASAELYAFAALCILLGLVQLWRTRRTLVGLARRSSGAETLDRLAGRRAA